MKEPTRKIKKTLSEASLFIDKEINEISELKKSLYKDFELVQLPDPFYVASGKALETRLEHFSVLLHILKNDEYIKSKDERSNLI